MIHYDDALMPEWILRCVRFSIQSQFEVHAHDREVIARVRKNQVERRLTSGGPAFLGVGE
jgi:hypothetical protein